MIQENKTIIRLGIENKCFEGIEFVSKAISKEKDRDVLRYISIEKKENIFSITGTDGKRLHSIEYKDVCNLICIGIFEVILITDKEIFLLKDDSGKLYPDWRCVIPKNLSLKASLNYCWDKTGSSLHNKIFEETGTSININYLLDSGIANPDLYVDSDDNDHCSPIILRKDYRQAIIMPMKYN
jgi:hypothetical protein